VFNSNFSNISAISWCEQIFINLETLYFLYLCSKTFKGLIDCYLMPTQQFFSYIMARTSYNFNEMMMIMLSWIYIVLAH